MNQVLAEKEKKVIKDMENSKIKILTVEESLKKLLTEKKSICRLSDGEMNIIFNRGIGYQNPDTELAKRLKEILQTKQDFCFVGITEALNRLDNLTDENKEYWINNMYEFREKWLELLNEDMEYLAVQITRPYIRYKDRSMAKTYFKMLKDLWKDRDVIICEGEQTRLGVGNDLLKECKSIKRILCPSENAFSKYTQILKELKKESKDSLFLIALGPTATILAYDLAKEGFQALDVGHVDIEYEWYLKKATTREKIENKYTNEVSGGNSTQDVQDEEYIKQIKQIIK